jgi:hypothetical protein
MGEGRGAYRILMGRPEGRRPHGRPRRRWEYNIKMQLQEVGWEGMHWIDIAQDRDRWRAVVNAVMNCGCLSGFLLFRVLGLMVLSSILGVLHTVL